MCEPMKPAPPVTRKRDEGAISVREQRVKYGGAGGIKSMNRTAGRAPGPGGGGEHVVGRLDTLVFPDPPALEAKLVQHALRGLIRRIGHRDHPGRPDGAQTVGDQRARRLGGDPRPQAPAPAGRRPRRPARPASGSARHAEERAVAARLHPPEAERLVVAPRSLQDAQAPALPRLRRGLHPGRAAHVSHHLGIDVERDQVGHVGRRPAGAGEDAASRASGTSRAPLLAHPARGRGRLDCPGPHGYCSSTQMLRSLPAPSVTLPPKEVLMRRVLILGFALLFVVGLGLVPPASAQTKDDTLVYALQSDIDNWDPPNSVLRESDHPRLPRLRPPGRARPQDPQGGAEPGTCPGRRSTTPPGR